MTTSRPISISIVIALILSGVFFPLMPVFMPGPPLAFSAFAADRIAARAVTLREPVVIVPGIAGTILQRTADRMEVWPNVNAMLVSPSDRYLDALALNMAGNAPAGGGRQSTVQTAGVLKTAKLMAGGITLFSNDFYGNLVSAFKNLGYVENKNIFMAPYDWRLDINASVAALRQKVRQAVSASPTGKVAIVAHSMGGLLVKAYLAGSGAADALLLDKVVLVGVPELGAPYAYKILKYGDDLNIPIANQDEIKKIAQNMPAIYELLPSQRYLATNGNYVKDFTNAASGSAGGSFGNTFLLNAAVTFHAFLDTVPPAGLVPNVYTIAGCGKPTITGYDLYRNGVIDLERGSGDGTVPDASAAAMRTAGSHDYFVMSGATGIDHTGLVSDPRPVALITNIVAGTRAFMLPQGISTKAADCATQAGLLAQPNAASGPVETTIEFSAHGIAGTANFGVYDAAGRYTGITASGTVAEGIPGSDYQKLGDNAFITVPAGKTYRAVDQPVATGTFGMTVRGYRGGVIEHEAIYSTISASAELNFSGFGGNMKLNIKSGPGASGAVKWPVTRQGLFWPS